MVYFFVKKTDNRRTYDVNGSILIDLGVLNDENTQEIKR